MRFYTKQHPFYCGIDLHARTMSLCILHQDGESLVHRNMPAGPEPFLQAIAPYRERSCRGRRMSLHLVCGSLTSVPVQGCPLSWATRCSMQAIHGGKATHDTIDAQKIAVLLRGGMLPQAYVSPAAMRATRDLLRRRMPLHAQAGGTAGAHPPYD